MRRNGNQKDRGSIAPQSPAKKDGRDRLRGSGQADARKGSPVFNPVSPQQQEKDDDVAGLVTIEVLSSIPNGVVLRLPWRRYPGALIQGDDLSGLCANADKACEVLLKRFPRLELTFGEEEGVRALISLHDDLHEIFEHYCKVTAWNQPLSSSTA